MKNLLFFLVALFLVSSEAYALNVELVVMEGSIKLIKNSNGKEDLGMGEFCCLPIEEIIKIKAGAKGAILSAMASNKTKTIIKIPENKSIEKKEIEKCISPSSTSQYLASIRNFFKPRIGAASGRKRLDDQENLPNFPKGTLLRPKGELVVRLDNWKETKFSNFLLSEAGRDQLLHSVSIVDGSLKIPASVLDFGKDYYWSVKKDGVLKKGQFAVAEAEDQEAFEEEIKSTQNYENLSTQGKLLLRAIKAKEWQYYFDMSIAANQIKSDLGE